MIDNLPEIDQYEGHPVIKLNPESSYPFSFGINKAKLFVREYHKIKSHYDEYFKLWKKAKTENDPMAKDIMKATLTLEPGSKYPVRLTMAKCKMIINNLEAIKSFINHA